MFEQNGRSNIISCFMRFITLSIVTVTGRLVKGISLCKGIGYFVFSNTVCRENATNFNFIRLVLFTVLFLQG